MVTPDPAPGTPGDDYNRARDPASVLVHSRIDDRNSKRKRPELVAPIWHTVVLTIVLISLAVGQGLQQNSLETVELRSRLPLYISMMVFELTLLAYVWLFGLRARHVRLRDLVGGEWASIEDVGRDVMIGGIFWLTVIGVLFVLSKILGTNPTGIKAVGVLLPQRPLEMIVWVILAITAGFCEEVIFRGYFQRQFFALTGKAEWAIALQALIFGMAHIYQGVKGALTIAIYGAMFGVLAAARKSLRPGMIQHGGQDIFSGIVGSILKKRGLF
jgi:membrane protease YdiL (CAAX protease family)